MARNGYGTVDDKGYLSFASAFEESACKDISIEKHDSEDMIALPRSRALDGGVLEA